MAGLMGSGGVYTYKSATVTRNGNSTDSVSAAFDVKSAFGIPEKIAKKLTKENFYGQVTNYNNNIENDYPSSSILCSILSYTPSTGMLSVRCSANYAEILITKYEIHAVWVE